STEFSVVGIAWEGSIYLAQVAIGKGIFHYRHIAERHRDNDIGFRSVKFKPNVSITNDFEIAYVFFLTPLSYGFSSGLQHLVVCVRTASFGVKRQAEFGRLHSSQQLYDRRNVPLLVRLLSEDVTGIESQTQVMHIFHLYTKMGPDQL